MRKFILLAAIAVLGAAPVAAAPPTITLKAAPAVVIYGGSTTLSGVLSTQRSGQSVDILAQACGTTPFKKIATVTSTTGGAFSYVAKPTINTNYQAKQRGATSPTAAVKVAPQLRLLKRSSPNPSRRFTAAVTAGQSFGGKYVVFQRRTSTKWLTVKKVTLTSAVPGTPPTIVTSQKFAVRIKRHPKVRVLLPASQAGTCYLPAKSPAIRS